MLTAHGSRLAARASRLGARGSVLAARGSRLAARGSRLTARLGSVRRNHHGPRLAHGEPALSAVPGVPYACVDTRLHSRRATFVNTAACRLDVRPFTQQKDRRR
ncbi:hypothetical protein B2G74_24960 [Burkholderia sp. A27]|nr:hypothetical protein B2G74_24960 [Burkholderia sp. A27]